MDDEEKPNQPISLPSAETWERMVRGFVDLVHIVHSVMEKVHAGLERSEPYLAAIGANWPNFVRIVNELPAKSKEGMQRTLARGWFFGWHDSMQSLVELVDHLSITADHDIDQVMVEYYRANLQSFAEELTAGHPGRAMVIRAAVDAHMTMPDSGYSLSTLAFIAQGDGILAEVIGVQQPMRDGAEIVRTKYGTDPSLLDLLYPFLELKNSPFAMSTKARKECATADWLNRHQVMHGERSDYGTEMNSLKAFSFLVFVGLHMPAVLPNSDH